MKTRVGGRKRGSGRRRGVKDSSVEWSNWAAECAAGIDDSHTHTHTHPQLQIVTEVVTVKDD